MFEVGNIVKIKEGLTSNDAGVPEGDLELMYDNNYNIILKKDNDYDYLIKNIVFDDDTSWYFAEEDLILLSSSDTPTEEERIKQIVKDVLNEPYNIKVKYHDSSMPKFEQIEKGNWIDCRVIKGGKITHSDGTKEPLEWKQDKDGTYYIEYKQGDFMMLPLGFSLNQGKGYEVNLVPRSSTFKNYGIIQTNHFGVGDDTFVGNNDMYHFPCYALRDGRINLYDRICQMKINKAMPQVIFNEVEDMESEDRGGFGSTGVE